MATQQINGTVYAIDANQGINDAGKAFGWIAAPDGGGWFFDYPTDKASRNLTPEQIDAMVESVEDDEIDAPVGGDIDEARAALREYLTA